MPFEKFDSILSKLDNLNKDSDNSDSSGTLGTSGTFNFPTKPFQLWTYDNTNNTLTNISTSKILSITKTKSKLNGIPVTIKDPFTYNSPEVQWSVNRYGNIINKLNSGYLTYDPSSYIVCIDHKVPRSWYFEINSDLSKKEEEEKKRKQEEINKAKEEKKKDKDNISQLQIDCPNCLSVKANTQSDLVKLVQCRDKFKDTANDNIDYSSLDKDKIKDYLLSCSNHFNKNQKYIDHDHDMNNDHDHDMNNNNHNNGIVEYTMLNKGKQGITVFTKKSQIESFEGSNNMFDKLKKEITGEDKNKKDTEFAIYNHKDYDKLISKMIPRDECIMTRNDPIEKHPQYSELMEKYAIRDPKSCSTDKKYIPITEYKNAVNSRYKKMLKLCQSCQNHFTK